MIVLAVYPVVISLCSRDFDVVPPWDNNVQGLRRPLQEWVIGVGSWVDTVFRAE